MNLEQYSTFNQPLHKVEVYKNLRKDCWSVRDNKSGKVICHVKSIWIKDAKLVVRPSGRQKVLETNQKNVHAFIKGYVGDYIQNASGDWIELNGALVTNPMDHKTPVQVTYSPYLDESLYFSVLLKFFAAFSNLLVLKKYSPNEK